MRTKILQINVDIQRKSAEFCDYVEGQFSGIKISPVETADEQVSNKRTPPITYILYVVAILLIIPLEVSTFILALVCMFIGYRIKVTRESKLIKVPVYDNISTVKNSLVTNVLACIKKVVSEWSDYMQLNQNEVLELINSADIDINDKNIKLSKVCVYEIIDISTSDFLNKINGISDVASLEKELNLLKRGLINAINTATKKQVEKYNQII